MGGGMAIIISSRALHPKGILFTFQIDSADVKMLFLSHALDRIEKWQLSLSMVADTLIEPEEVLAGHHNRFIAHKCYGEHVLRAVYEYDDSTPVLITVYFPYKKRYFKGGGNFEDNIFPGS